MLDWGDLRFFAELTRTGSLSATARRLRVDHSTVARRIAALEESLGVRLFDRLPRGYALTAEGERIAERAARLEDDILAIERLAQGRRGAHAGTVRISAPPVFASHFLAPRLAALRGLHPEIEIELIGESRAASLTRREADLAVRLQRPADSSLVTRKLGGMAYGLYAAQPYAASREPDDWVFLGYDESLDHVPQQRWLKRVAAGRPMVFRTNDLASLYEAARAGMGAAALPCFLAAADGRLARLPAEGADEAMRELWLLVHKDLRRSPRVRAAMDFLVDAAKRDERLLRGCG
jgi:DNA-binding transcriptional LysR family regulator